MTVAQVKKTLKNESQLLEHMIKCVQDYEETSFTKEATYIHKSWGRFLQDRLSASRELQKMSDRDFKKNLEAELAQVEWYVRITEKKPQFKEDWPAFLDCECEILRYLINEC